jgi:hypothetical protein
MHCVRISPLKENMTLCCSNTRRSLIFTRQTLADVRAQRAQRNTVVARVHLPLGWSSTKRPVEARCCGVMGR